LFWLTEAFDHSDIFEFEKHLGFNHLIIPEDKRAQSRGTLVH